MLRKISRLVAIVVVPFAVIWALNMAVASLAGAPATAAKRATRFGDYALVPLKHQRLPASVLWSEAPVEARSVYRDLQAVGDALVVAGGNRLLIIDRTTRVVETQYDLKQTGLGLVDTTTVGLGPSPDEVWLYSFRSGRSALASAANGVRGSVTLEPSLLDAAWVDAHTILASGAFGAELLRRFRPVVRPAEPGTSVRFDRPFGPPLVPGLPPSLAQHLNMSALAVSPSRSLVAVALRWSDRIYVFRAASMQLERAIAGPSVTKMEFDVTPLRNQQVLAFNDDTAYSYVDIAASDSFIFALYSGRSMRDARTDFGSGAEIHAFTWDGRPVGRWALDESVDKITVSARGDTLYGLRSRANSAVIEYVVPDLP